MNKNIEELRNSFFRKGKRTSYDIKGKKLFCLSFDLPKTIFSPYQLDLFQSQNIFPKVFLRERESEILHVGLGQAISFTKEEVDNGSLYLKDVPLFAIFPFFSSYRSKDWKSFQKYDFFLPEIAIVENEITFSILADHEKESEGQFSKYLSILEQVLVQHDDQLQKLGENSSLKISFEVKQMLPNFDVFKKTIDKFKRDDNLTKIVLARKKSYAQNSPFPQTNHQIIEHFLSRYFDKQKNIKESSYLFIFSLSPEDSFISTSPELLFDKNLDNLFIDSLAGTRPRGKNDLEDLKYEEELLSSPKEQQEQDIVTQGIHEVMVPIADIEEHNNKVILKLSHLMHLKTSIRAKLKSSFVSKPITKLIQHLHPTAAVGGYPQKLALDFLFENEAFDRGPYAAPFGLIKGEKAHFIVGIRSAHLQKGDLHLFAGAGILKNSDPLQEWQEIETKFEHIERYFIS